jgi:hypothetical protein
MDRLGDLTDDISSRHLPDLGEGTHRDSLVASQASIEGRSR